VREEGLMVFGKRILEEVEVCARVCWDDGADARPYEHQKIEIDVLGGK
jgi:hypothetical protein